VVEEVEKLVGNKAFEIKKMNEFLLLSRNFSLFNFHFIFKDYDANDLADFEETILKGCDFNHDGKISRKELTMILLALATQTNDD
jgi:hypothetical protein